MKTQTRIDSPENFHWSNPILKDRQFIKKHHRFPLTGRIILSIFILALPILIYIGIMTLSLDIIIDGWKNLAKHPENMVYQLIFCGFLLAPLLILLKGLRSIRFKCIPAESLVSANMEQISTFLQTEQIAFYRHPDAPEVFQISSRIIDPSSQSREIMVFIADDKQILVNNHISSKKGPRLSMSFEQRKLLKKFRKWQAAAKRTNQQYYPSNRKSIGS